MFSATYGAQQFFQNQSKLNYLINLDVYGVNWVSIKDCNILTFTLLSIGNL